MWRVLSLLMDGDHLRLHPNRHLLHQPPMLSRILNTTKAEKTSWEQTENQWGVWDAILNTILLQTVIRFSSRNNQTKVQTLRSRERRQLPKERRKPLKPLCCLSCWQGGQITLWCARCMRLVPWWKIRRYDRCQHYSPTNNEVKQECVHTRRCMSMFDTLKLGYRYEYVGYSCSITRTPQFFRSCWIGGGLWQRGGCFSSQWLLYGQFISQW